MQSGKRGYFLELSARLRPGAPAEHPRAGCRFLNAVRRGELLVSGGDDRRGRTRVAAATGAIAPGASRSRRRDLRIAALAWLRPAAGPAAQEAQAPLARPHLLYRGPAHARHHRVSLRYSG